MKREWIDSRFLGAMGKIVEDCRQTMGLDAELNWNEGSLKESLKSAKVMGAVDEGDQLRAFVLLVELVGSSGEKGAEIWCLATDPTVQNRGLMGQLLDELKTHFAELWLEVHGRNQIAISFYIKQGFQQVGVRKKYYRDGADAVLFCWREGSTMEGQR